MRRKLNELDADGFGYNILHDGSILIEPAWAKLAQLRLESAPKLLSALKATQPTKKWWPLQQNPTIVEVVQSTRLAMEKHKVARPKTTLFFLKRYSDLSGVVAPRKGKPFYATDYFDVYGPFKTLEAADNFVKEVLRKYSSAMRQAEVASWKAEGKELGKFGYL